MMGIRKTLCDKIKALYKAGYTAKELAERFNIKENIVLSIINH